MPYDLGMATYLFHQGTNYRSFDYLGVHREGDLYAFRVWAPHASAVFAVGDFNGWSESDPLARISEAGVFEGFVSADRFGEGSVYKFKLHTPSGTLYKADPYAVCAEIPPATASVYRDIGGYAWRDASWMAYRKKKDER